MFTELKGYNVSAQSLINILPVEFDVSIPKTDWIFFSSRNAVEHFFSKSPKIKENTHFGAIGSSTALVLKKYVKVSFQGTGDTHQVGKTFKSLIGNQTVLFPISDRSIRTVQKELNKEQVTDLIVYHSDSTNKIHIPHVDILIFTSPSNVEAYFHENEISSSQKVIAIGNTTKEALLEKGINALISWQSSELALSDLLN